MMKTAFFLSAVFVQAITSQCIQPPRCANIQHAANIQHPCEYSQNYYGFNPLTLSSLSTAPSTEFIVTSSSPIAPVPLTVTSENCIEGPLSVYGQLPFLSAVGFEAVMPTSGYGTVAYHSGSGSVGITSETYNPAGSHPGSEYKGHYGLESCGIALPSSERAYGCSKPISSCRCK